MSVPLQWQNGLQDALASAGQGNDLAFRAVYEHLSDRIFAYLRSRARSRDEAADIMQEVFLDVWNALPKFHYITDAHFYSFVFTITKRKLIRHYKTKTHESLDDVDTHLHPSIDADITDPDGMQNLVKLLPEKYRDVVTLRYWSGLSFAEIGHHLGITENNAKVRHHRALKELEMLMGQQKHG
jgi:RNA polymerase sigma-70 factor (ECF subfamily)